MQPAPSNLATVVALLICGVSICLLAFVVDPTPLLVEPEPDLDIPLGLAGVVAGLWSAHQITRLPFAADRKIGRWALWIMLPLWSGFGLPSFAARLQERHSFRNGGAVEEVTVPVGEKESSSGGRKASYSVSVISPVDQRAFDVRVDAATFEKVTPNVKCVTLLIERAPEGAVRLIRPMRWNVPCSDH